MKSLLCSIVMAMILASGFSVHAEEGISVVAAIVYMNGGGDGIPKVCYYDYEMVKETDSWNDGLLGCDPALIGKAEAPTPTSPPEGFGVLFHHVEASRRTGYTCSDFVQVTDTVGIHCVIGTKERREALRHPTPKNTRVTNGGCINVPTDGLFRRYSARIKLVHIVE